MSRRDFFQIFCMFYLQCITRKCAKEKKQQYLMLYQTWNRTSVYFKLAVSASYWTKGILNSHKVSKHSLSSNEYRLLQSSCVTIQDTYIFFPSLQKCLIRNVNTWPKVNPSKIENQFLTWMKRLWPPGTAFIMCL